MKEMKEEEFFDAIETGLDQIEFEAEREQRLARLDNEVCPLTFLNSSFANYSCLLLYDGVVFKA
jgi:hypothetical protein